MRKLSVLFIALILTSACFAQARGGGARGGSMGSRGGGSVSSGRSGGGFSSGGARFNSGGARFNAGSARSGYNYNFRGNIGTGYRYNNYYRPRYSSYSYGYGYYPSYYSYGYYDPYYYGYDSSYYDPYYYGTGYYGAYYAPRPRVVAPRISIGIGGWRRFGR